ncbi:MAG: PD-(D/E)XK nuclease family protein [Patescibacteria group bacterium]|jgi:CRISPR-associated protein Cas4
MFKASAFKLKMFALCPQQYKFYYIDDLAKEFKKPKPYLTMGAHVHNALHDFYEKFPPKQRTWENLEKLLRKRWLENRDGFAGKEEEKKFGMKALQMLKFYFHKNDVLKTPVMLEDYYDTEVDENLKVLGRIDRVDEEETGLHVIDYKTGKVDEEDISDLQLILYSLIMARNTKKPVVKASYLYLQNNQWHTINITEEKFNEAVETIKKQVEKIRAEKEFAPRINKLCKHCDFMEICPKREEISKIHE